MFNLINVLGIRFSVFLTDCLNSKLRKQKKKKKKIEEEKMGTATDN